MRPGMEPAAIVALVAVAFMATVLWIAAAIAVGWL